MFEVPVSARFRRDSVSLIDELTSRTDIQTWKTGEPRRESRLFWLDDGEISGTINVRFRRDTEDLLPHVDGHIGYAMVPLKTRCGCATEALRQMLPVAREVGLKRVRVTCVPENEASSRVILKDGGNSGCRYETADVPTKLWFRITL
jgi:predicted acetyltransferase